MDDSLRRVRREDDVVGFQEYYEPTPVQEIQMWEGARPVLPRLRACRMPDLSFRLLEPAGAARIPVVKYGASVFFRSSNSGSRLRAPSSLGNLVALNGVSAWSATRGLAVAGSVVDSLAVAERAASGEPGVAVHFSPDAALGGDRALGAQVEGWVCRCLA